MLALDIFHHFLKTKDAYYSFLNFLSRIKANCIFFEPHNPSDTNMKDSFINYEPADFAKLITSKCGMRSCELIGYSQDGRHIYMLKK